MPANALKVENREFTSFEATSQNGQVQLSGEYTVTVTNTGILPVPVTLSVTEVKLDGNTIIEDKTAKLGTVSGEAEGTVEFEATVSSSSAINSACASQPVNAEVNESVSGFLLAIVTEEEVEVKSPSPSCNIGAGSPFPGGGGGTTDPRQPGGGGGGGGRGGGGGGGGGGTDPRQPGGGGDGGQDPGSGGGGGQPEPVDISISGPSEVNTGETAQFSADVSGNPDVVGWTRSDTDERPAARGESYSISLNDPSTITVQVTAVSGGQALGSDSTSLTVTEDQGSGGQAPGGGDDPRDPGNGGGGGSDPRDPGGGGGGPNIPDQPPDAEIVNLGRQNNPDYGDVAYVNTTQTYQAQSNGDRIEQYDTSDYTWEWELGNEETKSSAGPFGIVGSPAQIDYSWDNTGMKTIRVEVTHQDSGQIAMQLTMTEEVTEQGTVIPDPPTDTVVVNKGRQDDPGFGENEAAFNDTTQTYQVRAPGDNGDQLEMYDTSDYTWEWTMGDDGSKSTGPFGIVGAPSQIDYDWDNDRTGDEVIRVVVTSDATGEEALNVAMTETLQNQGDSGGGFWDTNSDGVAPSMDEKADIGEEQ